MPVSHQERPRSSWFLALLTCALIVGCSALQPASPLATDSDATPSASASPNATTEPSPIVQPSTAPTVEPTATTPTQGGAADFPKSILGMPVLSVSELSDLIASGKVDGRVAAVRGYWLPSMVPSCAAPNRWYAPIEHYCGYDVFSDPGFELIACSKTAQGSECHGNTPPPGTTYMTPQLIDDASGQRALLTRSYQGTDPLGTPAILVGHVGDARAFQCPAEARSGCLKAFVVDRVAWVDGAALDLTVPADSLLQTKLSLDDLATALPDGALLTAVPLAGRDVPTIDPRLHAVGNSVVWVARSLSGESSPDQTGNVAVSLIDDASGSVSQRLDLTVRDSYRPASVRFQAVVRGIDPNTDRRSPFYRIDLSDGTGVQEGGSSGWAQHGDDSVKYGPGMPAIVDAGSYKVSAWLAPYDHPEGVETACSRDLDVGAADEVRLEAAFDADGSCVWQDPTFPDSL